MAKECAREAYRRLLENRTLAVGDCANSDDLSCLADAVALKRAGRHDELVACLPRDEFRSAKPNDGHLLAALLLREGAVIDVLTLNFDLALTNALNTVGASADVGHIQGPESHADLRAHNLVYLHRNVNEADGNQWILRTEQLEPTSADSWQQLIVNRMLYAPVCVFVGLGFPSKVLIETATRIGRSGPGTIFFLVDAGDRADSAFFAALSLPSETYHQMTWCEFMRVLGARVLDDQIACFEKECRQLEIDNGWDSEDYVAVRSELRAGSLLFLAELRAHWALSRYQYAASSDASPTHLADLLCCVAVIQRLTSSRICFRQDGSIDFRRNGQLVLTVVVASGKGTIRWSRLEALVRERLKSSHGRGIRPQCVIMGGVPEGRPNIATHPNIGRVTERSSIIDGDLDPEFFSVGDIHDDPSRVSALAQV
jgi:hypothetical protein